MLPTWAEDVLKSNGLAGVFILVLILAIVAIVRMFRAMLKERDAQIKELQEQRSQERETLVRLLEGANTAQRMTAEATSKRNDVIEDQTGAIMTLANSNDRLNDRIANQAEMFRDRLDTTKHVIDATGESYRVLNGLVTEIRNGLQNLVGQVTGVAVDVKTLGSK